MSDLLYRIDLLRLAAAAHGAGRIGMPQASGQAYNPACGDRVLADLLIENGRIADFAHDTKACVLAQASASILGATLQGSTRSDLEGLRREVVAMLEANAPPPAQPFGGFSVFAGAIDYPSRHRCVLLPIDAVLDALAQYAESGR